jgi:hypothetical protein
MCLAAIVWISADFPAFVRHVSVQFDWEQSQGFKSFAVTWPKFRGHTYSRFIAGQAKRQISSLFRKGGWKAASGEITLDTFCFVYVFRVSQEGNKIIDPQVTPLMHAAEEDNTSALKELIARGAGINAQDQQGWTALTYAVVREREEATKILLNAGANPDIRDRGGRTPFWWAAYKCQYGIGVALVAAGADVNTKDDQGATGMTSTPCKEVVQKMLEGKGSK